MSDPDEPSSWVAKAHSDWQCIENNLIAADIPWDAVAFHAQQAAEKMLKALLVSRGIEVPRTHDLGRLLGECLAVGWPVDALSDACDTLAPYAVTMRYPGDEADVTEADGRDAVAAARSISDAVLAKLTSGA